MFFCIWVYSEFTLVLCELRTECLSQLNITSVEKMNMLELEYVLL